MGSLSKYEQETVINFNAGEQTAVVYTRDKAVMRKLDALVIAFPEVYKLVGETDIIRPIPCLNHALVIVSRENWMINTENKKEGKWHSIICKGKSLKKCMFNDIILSTEGMCKGD